MLLLHKWQDFILLYNYFVKASAVSESHESIDNIIIGN